MRLRDLYNVAGLLTLARLLVAALAPFWAPLPVAPWIYAAALASDVGDGIVARRLGHASAAGAALDGWVDKVLHVNLAWSLALADRIPDVWVALWCSREIVQAPLVFLLVARFRRGLGPRPRTSPWGRATTMLLAATVLGALLGVDVTMPTWGVGALGVLAGLDYARVHLGAMLREEARAAASPAATRPGR